jgi:outer membrane protein assembly factor BamA
VSARSLTVALLAFALALLRAAAAGAQPGAAGNGQPAAPPAIAQVLPPPDLSAFIGRKVTRVEITLEDDTWSDVAIPSVRTVRAGLDFVPALARQLLDEVLASGLFARGRVSVLEEPGGVRLVAHVVPRKLIESLRVDLHGAPVQEDELLRDADLATGGELVAKDLPDQQARIEAFFASRGFPNAVVNITTRQTDSVQRVTVLVDVVPGAPFALTHRRFIVFGAAPKAVDATNQTYAVHPGDRMDQATLESADLGLANRLRAQGYHHASVAHDVVVQGATSTLQVRVDTGPLFVPRYEGNEHFDADGLDGSLDLANESDRTPGHLVQKIKTFYVKHGFLDAEVTIEQRGLTQPEPVRVVYLVFHIVEHDRVGVVARLYPCLKAEDIKPLREAPSSASAIGTEIDSFLEEELPGQDLVKDPHPEGLDELVRGPSHLPRGQVPVPIDLDPDATFDADTYERALLHVQELYRNEGFLHAQVGPVQIVRRRCAARSPADRCIPVPLPREPMDACTYDATNLPLPVPPIDPALSCTPDPAHGIACEPRLSLRIPIKLGPRTILYDLAFYGARSIPEKTLATAAALTLGDPANALKLEEARRRVVDAYKEEGFAYVDVKYTLDASLDHTRARARFDIVEGKRVIVRQIVIRGNERTSTSVIKKRLGGGWLGGVVLEIGKPYRTSEVNKARERIATLNVFTSVSVSLEDAYVPQENKAVIIDVVERTTQYTEIRPGISTGEGLRFAFEYGHRNLLGSAVSLSVRLQVSYLPDFLILDPQVRQNYDTAFGYPAFGQRIAQRDTITLALPDVGLGPLIRSTVDGLYVRDLERDFALSKGAFILTGYYRPVRQLQMSFAPDVELNDSTVFSSATVEQYLEQQQAAGLGNADLARLLRVPTGLSDAVAERFVVTWDRRDNPFNAHTGTLVAAGIEHVDWWSLQPGSLCPTAPRPVYNRLLNAAANNDLGTTYDVQSLNNPCEPGSGHFFRITQTVAGYLPLSKKITLAGELRMGVNIQTVANSATYPDRLFFMGGIESMRGYLQDTFMPQDQADRIAASFNKPASDPTKFTQADVALRGGNLMINPRLELRVPLLTLGGIPLETALFFDSGNIWTDATYPFHSSGNGINGFPLRTAFGSGIRIQTPIGPIVFDYGINLSRLVTASNDPRRTYEDFGAFHFAIGLF